MISQEESNEPKGSEKTALSSLPSLPSVKDLFISHTRCRSEDCDGGQPSEPQMLARKCMSRMGTDVLTEGNEGNEGSEKNRPFFVTFVTFCKKSLHFILVGSC